MGTGNQVSLGALRLQSQQRADLENSSYITTSEWNQYISQSAKDLTDLLVAAYGNDYQFATPYQFTTTNAQSYALPDGTTNFRDTSGGIAPKFYKLLGLDLQYSASPTGFVTIQRFEFIERNKFGSPNTSANYSGLTNLRYRIQGDNLYVIPVPTTGQTMQVWYIPAPTPLQYMLPVVTASSGTIGSLTDTVGLSVGMNVSGSGVPTGTTLSAVGSLSITVSAAFTATSPSAILSFWKDSTLIDGIAGWEEYIVIDSAIKAYVKQETDYTGLAAQKAEMKHRIESMSEGRDAGQAHHVSDAMSVNSWGTGYDGGWGSGGDGY